MKAVSFFVGSTIAAFALWYFHVVPTESIVILLVSSFLGIAVAVNIEEWLKDLLCYFIAGIKRLGGSMSILALIVIFALGLTHVIPGNFFVGLCVLWSLGVSMEVSSRVKRGKVKRIENPIPPYGLGGCVTDKEPPCDPCGYGGCVPAGQSNSSLISLMKGIEKEISANKEAINYPALMARSTIGVDWLGKSDKVYEEPVASYPEFGTNDIPPGELFDDPRQPLRVWMIANGIRGLREL